MLVHIRTPTNGRLGHADLIHCMNLTLDGYIAAVGEGIGWSGPPAEPRAVSVVARPRTGERPVAVWAQAVEGDEAPIDSRPAAQRHPAEIGFVRN